jgi:predicted enzyme involved in methoxymalonyl-ACP biosynthesis
VTELDAYLHDLDMRLVCSNFDEPNIQRIVQLIARWNQFDLMPRRYGEEDVRSIIGDPGAFGLHLRLVDRFGSSGVIAIVIGRLRDNADLEIDA